MNQAKGVWVQDKFRLGQLTVDVNNINFGVASRYNTTPVLGLDTSTSDVLYPTFLEVMQSQDIINTVTYGIYLGDIRGRDDAGKSIIFGGLDVAKFQWPLKTYSSVTGYKLDLLTINIRSAYVFYDFRNLEISLAPSIFNVTATNVTEVGVNNASVTALEWLTENSSVTSVIPEPPPPPPPTTSPPTPTFTPEPVKKLNIGRIVGEAVGGVTGLAVIIIAIWYYVSRKRNRNSRPAPMAPDGMPPTPMMDEKTTGGRASVGFANSQFTPAKPNDMRPLPPISPISPMPPISSPNPWPDHPGAKTSHGISPPTYTHNYELE
ncbi:Barrierpepsin [Arthrobotrys entomopaga]|nr:Barrierpepsin [Arthrobotrys entomopaga]